ncbi:MAG: DNA double-strand break repair nuclease NurA [Candidatus Micrarchaeia archaeon]
MQDDIGLLAKRIRLAYHELELKAKAKRASSPGLVHAVTKSSPSFSVCAVDGGLLSQRMHGADIVLVRSVSVNFVYEGSRIRSFSYHPRKSPEPRVEIMDSLDEHESAVFRSLVRLRDELACAVSAVERFKPGYLLLDGSLLPLPSDRPPEGSILNSLYSEVISLHGKLREACGAIQCVLCGVIKDSRSKKISRDLGFTVSDTLLCEYLLEAGERTTQVPYAEDKPAKDIAGLAAGVSVFYIKASEHDLPIRVETLGEDIPAVAEAIYALSAISDSYAYPAVLVEADMCAAMDGREMESIESALISSGMRPLRRNARPFR